MKKLAKPVKVQEVEGEGLLGLLGQKVIVWCMNYTYHGTLEGVNEDDILLTEASVVYETGALCGNLKDAQKLPAPLYVRIDKIEVYYAHEG